MRQDGFLEVLRSFLSMPQVADPALEAFAQIPGARVCDFGGMERFVYVPPRRANAVLLVAHADTVSDADCPTALYEDADIIRNADAGSILGADDRAGCAMAFILGAMQGHGVLVTDGEEEGQIGAEAVGWWCGELFEELQVNYQFMVEFDRRESRNFKCYDVGTGEFREYVSTTTGYRDDGRSAATDICVLARDICGVNLASGFYGEHCPGEYLKKSDWLETLGTAIKWLGAGELPRFER